MSQKKEQKVTIGGGIYTVENELNKLRDLFIENPTSKESQKVRSLLILLAAQRASMIIGSIKQTTSEFKNSIKALESAREATVKATNDLKKVENAFKKIEDAIDVVAKAIKAISYII